MRVPSATYRLQLRPGFGFDEVAAVADYLHALGVSHVYLSPVLEAAPGSAHGYDVVDHSRVSAELGGRAALERMGAALAAHGLSAIADVVPNHMAVPTPVRLNAALWSVLRDGPASPYARWFDVDWSGGDHAVLMPVLGDRIGTVVAAGQLHVDRSGPEPVLRYHDHVFPVRPGTEDLTIAELVDPQWYRLAWWRVADEELNYRRFFDVDTLAGLRVEDPEVFEATHRVLLELVREGRLSGLRIDHPDGLADPRGYLSRLARPPPAASGWSWRRSSRARSRCPPTGRAPAPPATTRCCGSGGLFADPAAAAPLTAVLAEATGEMDDFATVVEVAKREVIEAGLYAEVHRLTELVVQICRQDIALRDHTRRLLRDCLVELLVGFDRYRAYVVPGESADEQAVATVESAARRARDRLPTEATRPSTWCVDLVLGRPVGSAAVTPEQAASRLRLAVRFQQTCGPVMAKGREDTAFYRYHRLTALNEVGGDPTRVGVPPEEFHAFAGHLQDSWPATMTTLSTHDTKRSEDVRARLLAMTELTAQWGEAVRGWTEAAAVHRSPAGWPDPATVYLTWQVLVGTWDGGPLSAQRLQEHLTKATREAKRFTSWTTPDPAFDAAVTAFAAALVTDEALMASIGAWCEQLQGPARVAALGQKLLQLTMPGVPDVYQGCESLSLTLVDPDNRGAVDFDGLRARLAGLDAGRPPRDLAAEKLLVTSRVLRLRRDHPEWFTGPDARYWPVATSSGNAVALARGDGAGPRVVAVATRLPLALERLGGWGAHTVALPPGRWVDLLHPGGAGAAPVLEGGGVPVHQLLGRLPVALLTAPAPA